MRALTTRTAMTLGVVGVLLTSSTQAGASQPKRMHCVAEAYPEVAGATPPPSIPRCFATFPEAIAFVTGGAIKLDPTISQAEQVAQLRSALEPTSAVGDALELAANATGVLLGTEFWDINYGGASWSWYGQTGCHWYTNDAYADMPAGWNDVVSSAVSYNGCGYFWHYEDIGQGGSISPVDCGWSCSYIGDSMNDRASSIRLSYWG